MEVFNERKPTGDMALKLRNQEECPDQRVNHSTMNLDVVVDHKSGSALLSVLV